MLKKLLDAASAATPLGWVRLAAVALLGLGVLVLLWSAFIRPGEMKAESAANKAEATVAKGEAAKAADAARIVENTHETIRTIERTTITNERQIRAAEGADAPLAPDVARALRAALCVRHAYQLHPACDQLPGTDPAGVAGADAGGKPAAG